jgi:hypothetical protein
MMSPNMNVASPYNFINSPYPQSPYGAAVASPIYNPASPIQGDNRQSTGYGASPAHTMSPRYTSPNQSIHS